MTTLQEATLREWSLLPPNLVQELQNFLFNYVVGKVCYNNNTSPPITNTSQTLDKYVQRAILQTLAVFYKRNKLDLSSSMSTGNDSSSASKVANMCEDVIKLFDSQNVKLVHREIYFQNFHLLFLPRLHL